MTLSQDDRDLLALLFFNGDKSVRELAKELKRKEHSVRYSLSKLIEGNYCYFRPFIDPAQFGRQEHQLFVSIKSGGAASRKSLTDALIGNDRVVFVENIGGVYQLNVFLLARNIDDVRKIFDDVSKASPKVEYEIDLMTIASMTYFSPNYLLPTKPRYDLITSGNGSEIHKLDSISEGILSGLYNPELSNRRDLAKKLKISEPTLSYRISSLKKAGVIMGLGYSPNFKKFKMVTCALLFKAKRPSSSLTKRLKEYCSKAGPFKYLIEGFGAWDYDVGVAVFDSSELNAVVDALSDEFKGEIGTINQIPTFDVIKLKAVI